MPPIENNERIATLEKEVNILNRALDLHIRRIMSKIKALEKEVDTINQGLLLVFRRSPPQ